MILIPIFRHVNTNDNLCLYVYVGAMYRQHDFITIFLATVAYVIAVLPW